MPSKKNKYKRKKHRGKKVYGRDLVRRATEHLPEYEVEVTTASRKLVNRLVGVAQRSKKASEIDLDVGWV